REEAGEMEPTQATATQPKATKAVEKQLENVEVTLRERIEHARDIVEDLRDRAEIAFHERPYLLPVATGVLGLGVGVLIGSKLSRILLFTTAGALLSDTLRHEVARISREFVKNLDENMDETELAESHAGTEEAPSVT
ncbi:MAG TPA: hypothetical protein VM580_33430, partial [Labilithrix sp.]|nr:hypothetical protein [Labilithrix sp.]